MSDDKPKPGFYLREIDLEGRSLMDILGMTPRQGAQVYRCTNEHCRFAREAKLMEYEGMRLFEQPGTPCSRCGAGTLGVGDAADSEISQLMAKEQERVDMASVAARIGSFNQLLVEQGLDSQTAMVVTMRFVDGHIKPDDFRGWK